MSYTNGLDDPTLYFNTVLYTGNATARDITTGLETTDFIWNKRRDSTGSHLLYDKVRGVNKDLNSESTEAEETQVGTVTAFGTDSFSLGTHGGTNGSGESKVTWCWSAGGTTGSSNTDGSITSTVSANTTSGFSIVSYAGNSTSGATIGHSLGTTPSMIIVKSRTSAYNWAVYHSSVGATKYLRLNDTLASTTSSARWNDTTPTSSVFTLGNAVEVNETSGNYIAYCFAEKKGFSKFGSYNANADSGGNGPYVYTGFKPAFILAKNTAIAQGWVIIDNKRDTFNEVTKGLQPNTNGAETDSSANNGCDFLSNGFKIRAVGTGDLNYGSGQTYIYMAFAENPFVTSTGIPTTAR